MPNAPEAREGDVNLSPNRAAWRASLGEATRAALDEDERWFLHQSLSTPCLDEIVAAESEANKKLVSDWAAHWIGRSIEAAQPLAEALGIPAAAKAAGDAAKARARALGLNV